MKFNRVLFAGLMAGLLTLPQASMASNLSPDEIRELMVGKTVLFRIGAQSGRALLELRLEPDGTASTTVGGGDTGRWRMTAEGYCAQWKQLRNGEERCFVVKKVLGNHQVVAPDGSFSTIVDIK